MTPTMVRIAQQVQNYRGRKRSASIISVVTDASGYTVQLPLGSSSRSLYRWRMRSAGGAAFAGLSVAISRAPITRDLGVIAMLFAVPWAIGTQADILHIYASQSALVVD